MSHDNKKFSWLKSRENCRKSDTELIEVSNRRQKEQLMNYMKEKNIKSIWIGLSTIDWRLYENMSDLPNITVSFNFVKSDYELWNNISHVGPKTVCTKIIFSNGKISIILYFRFF